MKYYFVEWKFNHLFHFVEDESQAETERILSEAIREAEGLESEENDNGMESNYLLIPRLSSYPRMPLRDLQIVLQLIEYMNISRQTK